METEKGGSREGKRRRSAISRRVESESPEKCKIVSHTRKRKGNKYERAEGGSHG